MKCENTGSDLDDVTRSVNMRRVGTENSRIRRFMIENSLEFTRKIINKNRGVELAQKMGKKSKQIAYGKIGASVQ